MSLHQVKGVAFTVVYLLSKSVQQNCNAGGHAASLTAPSRYAHSLANGTHYFVGMHYE